MNCVICNQPIPEERLAAVPDATHCVRCLAAAGDAPRLRGVMVYDQKTGGRIEVASPEAFQRLRETPAVIEERLSRL